MNHDPYEVLGVDPSASAEELAAARRRRARELHPDLGGSDAAMQELNAAYDEAVRRSTAPPVEADTDPVVAERGDGRRPRGTQHGRVRIDHPSFTLDVLPVEPPVEPIPELLRAYRAREPWTIGRLIITPHSAFYTPQAWHDIRTKSAETMRAALLGPKAQNVIPPDAY